MTTGIALKNSKKVYLEKNKFSNALTNNFVSDKSYEHVFNVQKLFKQSAVKDYHKLHLKVDVLLLACVFETFRKEFIYSF